MRFTFYDGVNTVGGNKILLEADGTSLLLDFGENFSEMNRYFDEFMTPRSPVGILDYLELDLLPPLQGIFRPDMELEGIWRRKENHPWFRTVEVDALLLSHAHLDHCGFLRFLKAEIPVYSSLKTSLLLKVTQETSKDDGYYFFKELSLTEEGLLHKTTKKSENKYFWRKFFIFGERNSLAEEKWRETKEDALQFFPGLSSTFNFLGEREAKIGQLRVKVWPVDHSIPGACAYGIQTSSGWVIYTGDLRKHGKERGLTLTFAEEARKLKPLALIVEGTRISQNEEDSSFSEETVEENITEILRHSCGLVVADFGPRNIERLLSFLEAAKRCKRKLVITSKDLALLTTLQVADPSLSLPEKDPYLLVFKDVKARRENWEKELLEKYSSSTVTCRDIRNSQGDFVLCFSYFDLQELVDIQPQGGVYVLSSCEPFNEEMKIDQNKLEAWVDHFGLEKHGALIGEKMLHASGHMDREGLRELIEEINPQFVIPVHTEKPEAFAEIVPTRKLIWPEKGKALEL